MALLGLALIGVLVVAGVTYYVTPKYTRVGYQPQQPISFSHKWHVGELGLDCRYCHNHVGDSPHSNVPGTATCINCHGKDFGGIKPDSPELAPLRVAWDTGQPVPWIRIHKVPEYVYFNHAVHVKRGVSCVSCHGKVNEMEVVYHHEPLSMGWCLNCHRNPEKALRPADQVTNLNWSPNDSGSQDAFVKALIKDADIKPPKDCSACHR
ncbi:MAG: cytochrome c family protein [Planctomycetota bacterium]|nr:cytochrome c family protein [Planctomycetota bacterium]